MTLEQSKKPMYDYFTTPSKNIFLLFRIGYDELMGCVGIGTSYIGTGRDHWLDMLDNPRKPVAQWYTLMDSIPGPNPPTNSSIRFNCLTRR